MTDTSIEMLPEGATTFSPTAAMRFPSIRTEPARISSLYPSKILTLVMRVCCGASPPEAFWALAGKTASHRADASAGAIAEDWMVGLMVSSWLDG